MEQVSRPLILVVDDTRQNLELLSKLLERGGYDVAQAMDGPEALELATKETPDLILMDILMPGMNGIEVCRRLKADPATQGIPVIFLTAKSESVEILAGFDAGAVDYVTKPFRVSELLARVHVHVELRRARQEIRTLRGILPTCSYCKKIRDEQGQWHSIESYITGRSEAQCSHGICPDCIPLYFPDFHTDSSDAANAGAPVET